eukprot:gnl/Carplike_NY0171/353_a491_1596.p1 GENE.gnl/Carplike_NY0171/353_a491_1596~~gnl/Carplike_NY0171/353_a491_1596.p1  ORF type:complete len:1732 (+),score=681.12 gnl/Carplike_NY0171/353_a491_1596:3-5198(+)
MTSPITREEIAKLVATHGVSLDSISPKTLSIGSAMVGVVESHPDDTTSLFLLDLTSNEGRRTPSPVSMVSVHPSKKVFAVRGEAQISVIDQENRQKFSLKFEEEVLFMKFMTDDIFSIVTPSAAYFWVFSRETHGVVSEGKGTLARVFAMEADMASITLTDMIISPSKEFFLLTGEGRAFLYSKKSKSGRILPAFAGSFASINVAPGCPAAEVFAFATISDNVARLNVTELNPVKKEDGTTESGFVKRVVELGPCNNDYPISLTITSHGFAFVLFKKGSLRVVDLGTGLMFYSVRSVCGSDLLTAVRTDTGMVAGSVAGHILRFAVKEDRVIPHIITARHDPENAYVIAERTKLPGGDALFSHRFGHLFSSNQFKAAAEVVGKSPGTTLRNMETLKRFIDAGNDPVSNAPAFLIYLSTLMRHGPLTSEESVELVKRIVAQGKTDVLHNYIRDKKITCSEELGDFLRSSALEKEAFIVYHTAEAKHKVVAIYASRGEFDKIIGYCEKTAYVPDVGKLIHVIATRDPDNAVNLARKFAEKIPDCDVPAMAESLANLGLVKDATGLILSQIKAKEFNEETAPLQTRLLEINIRANPETAATILDRGILKFYDASVLAPLCEEARMFSHAVRMYSNSADKRRVVVNHTKDLQPVDVAEYASMLEDASEIQDLLRSLLTANLRANLQHVIAAAVVSVHHLSPNGVVSLLDEFRSHEGVFLFLHQVISEVDDPDMHFRYVEAGVKTGNAGALDGFLRTSEHLDAQRTLTFLKNEQLDDVKPLIVLCDRFDYIDELISHLLAHNLERAIEAYALKFNPAKIPDVVGALIDHEADDDLVTRLIQEGRNAVDISLLCDECEKRNKLSVLRAMLETRVSEGACDIETHTARVKVLVLAGDVGAEEAIVTADALDFRGVGEFCAPRDPHLAFVAFSRAGSDCEDELLSIASKGELFKELAHHAIVAQSEELWRKILSGTHITASSPIPTEDDMDELMDGLVDEDEEKGEAEQKNTEDPQDDSVSTKLRDSVVAEIKKQLPLCEKIEEVSGTIRAFDAANLTKELINVLECVIFGESLFSNNTFLQNLLILNSIQDMPERVSKYVSELSDYEGREVAESAVASELNEEALIVYKKFNLHVEALDVLVDHIRDMDRAEEYAQLHDVPEVWSRLAHSLLRMGRIEDGIKAFVRAEDPTAHPFVIRAAEESNNLAALVPFLEMARSKAPEPAIDTSLVFALAKLDRLGDMEDLIVGGTCCANLSHAGQKCYQNELYRAGLLIFRAISDYGSVAACHLKLRNFIEAIEAARMANNVRVWGEVMRVCVDAGEFRLAKTAGINVILIPEEIDSCISFYLSRGHVEHLIELLEMGTTHEKAHIRLFTELGVLYSKYSADNMMEFVKRFIKRCDVDRIARACQRAHLWAVLVFVKLESGNLDDCLNIMMAQSSSAWDHSHFMNIIAHVSTLDVLLRAIDFYVNQQPQLLNELLVTLGENEHIDVGQIVSRIRRNEAGFLALNWLEERQKMEDVECINALLHNLYIDNFDHVSLTHSVRSVANFDVVQLATRLSKHEYLVFRRVSTELFRRAEKWGIAISLAKKDRVYGDAIEAVKLSRDGEMAEELLTWFLESEDFAEAATEETEEEDKEFDAVKQQRHECFSATLFRCSDFIRPDIVLCLAWKHHISDYAMPFMIQTVRTYSTIVDELQKRVAVLERGNVGSVASSEEEDAAMAEAMEAVHDDVYDNAFE